MPKTYPTVEQIEALRQFARANGRRWKSELNHLWYNGAYNRAVLGGADPALLQQVRNSFGPSWLVRFRLPDPALKMAELPAARDTHHQTRRDAVNYFATITPLHPNAYEASDDRVRCDECGTQKHPCAACQSLAESMPQ
jgi:hypothetical protein